MRYFDPEKYYLKQVYDLNKRIDTDHKREKVRKTRRGFRRGIIDALRARKTKAL